MENETIDDATAELNRQLQQADLEEMQDALRSQDAGDPDAHLVTTLLEEELGRLEQTVNDRQMAQCLQEGRQPPEQVVRPPRCEFFAVQPHEKEEQMGNEDQGVAGASEPELAAKPEPEPETALEPARQPSPEAEAESELSGGTVDILGTNVIATDNQAREEEPTIEPLYADTDNTAVQTSQDTPEESQESRPELARSLTNERVDTQDEDAQNGNDTHRAPFKDHEGDSSSERSDSDEQEVEQVACINCRYKVPLEEATKLLCEHLSCAKCLEWQLKLALTDETMFPPKCCDDPIRKNIIEKCLTPEEMALFLDKQVEFETENKTYCYRTSCSKFIPPANIRNEKAACPVCGEVTCTICNTKAHNDQDCPGDPAVQSLLATAEDGGWQRCYSCKRMVSLERDCFHIT